MTQAEAWIQALPGPVTQFPRFYRSITTQGLLFSFEEALGQLLSVSKALHVSCLRAYYVPEALRTLDLGSQLSLKEVRNTIDHVVWSDKAGQGRKGDSLSSWSQEPAESKGEYRPH